MRINIHKWLGWNRCNRKYLQNAPNALGTETKRTNFPSRYFSIKQCSALNGWPYQIVAFNGWLKIRIWPFYRRVNVYVASSLGSDSKHALLVFARSLFNPPTATFRPNLIRWSHQQQYGYCFYSFLNACKLSTGNRSNTPRCCRHN